MKKESKKVTMKAVSSYGDEFKVSFIYNDTMTICNIQNKWSGHNVRGIAKLNPEDNYDVTIGENIAFEKALKTYKKLVVSDINKYSAHSIKILISNIDAMKKRLDRVRLNHAKKESKIKEKGDTK